MSDDRGAGNGTAKSADRRSAVRRLDRAKDDAWIEAFLVRAPFGFLASIDDEGQPFLNSNLFVYDATRHAIYLHTHRTGQTRDNLGSGGKVAFSVAGMGRILPASVALEFSVEYAGVVAFGTGVVVEDPVEAKAALQWIMDKYAPHLKPDRDYRPTSDADLARTAVLRIDIETWSGKQKEVAEDFPGAFTPPELPIPFPGRREDRP
jgi:nitroimidazol reductase NimA-like FMN-containing flavoprotein (pyridoxamine 5'-phosphate oxidase superfamily)